MVCAATKSSPTSAYQCSGAALLHHNFQYPEDSLDDPDFYRRVLSDQRNPAYTLLSEAAWQGQLTPRQVQNLRIYTGVGEAPQPGPAN